MPVGLGSDFSQLPAQGTRPGPLSAEIESAMSRQWPAHAGRLASEVLVFGYRPAQGAAEQAPATVPLQPSGRAPHSRAGRRDESWATLKQLCKLAGLFAWSLSRGLLVIFDDVERLGVGEVESLGHLARALSRDGLPVALL